MRVIKTTSSNQPIPLVARTAPASFPRTCISEKRKIALPTMEGIHFEKVETILSLEAQGNYTMLHFKGGRQLLVSKTLRDTEMLIDNCWQFIRVHRSYTINLDALEKYVRGKGGYVIMEDGSTINVSVSRKEAFLDAVALYFSCR